MNVAPSSSFETVADLGVTGLTPGVRIIDNAGNTTTARVTTGVTEYPASSGIYAKTLTAPATAGQYTILWDNGTQTAGNFATEDLVVSATAAAFGSGTLYVTAAALKQTLNIGSTYADDDIDIACEAASRACDGYRNLSPGLFAPTSSQTRYYDATQADTCISIDPLNSLTSVSVDVDGDGTYETTWTVGTDFLLSPYNAVTDGFPYTKIDLLSQAGRRFPGYQKSVAVVGSFGWAATPGAVAQASAILAGRFLKRSRETPYGIVVVSGDAVAAARLGRIDPDVAFLLDNLPGSVPLLAI
jgi:hypothetical protein